MTYIYDKRVHILRFQKKTFNAVWAYSNHIAIYIDQNKSEYIQRFEYDQ